MHVNEGVLRFLQASMVRPEILLLTTSLRMEDSCWEQRLKTGPIGNRDLHQLSLLHLHITPFFSLSLFFLPALPLSLPLFFRYLISSFLCTFSLPCSFLSTPSLSFLSLSFPPPPLSSGQTIPEVSEPPQSSSHCSSHYALSQDNPESH